MPTTISSSMASFAPAIAAIGSGSRRVQPSSGIALRRRSRFLPTVITPGRIDRNTISRIISSRWPLTNGTLPRK